MALKRLAVGVAIGYVLGAKAGEKRYRDLQKRWDEFRALPLVERLLDEAREFAETSGRSALQSVRSRLPESGGQPTVHHEDDVDNESEELGDEASGGPSEEGDEERPRPMSADATSEDDHDGTRANGPQAEGPEGGGGGSEDAGSEDARSEDARSEDAGSVDRASEDPQKEPAQPRAAHALSRFLEGIKERGRVA